MPSLENKVALVTGAGGGIGAAICHRLSREGAFIVAADMNFSAASKLAEQVRTAGGGVFAVQLDVTNQLQWRSAVAETPRVARGLPILVHKCGGAPIQPPEGVFLARREAAMKVKFY